MLGELKTLHAELRASIAELAAIAQGPVADDSILSAARLRLTQAQPPPSHAHRTSHLPCSERRAAAAGGSRAAEAEAKARAAQVAQAQQQAAAAQAKEEATRSQQAAAAKAQAAQAKAADAARAQQAATRAHRPDKPDKDRIGPAPHVKRPKAEGAPDRL